jgi:hypothetical protein
LIVQGLLAISKAGGRGGSDCQAWNLSERGAVDIRSASAANGVELTAQHVFEGVSERCAIWWKDSGALEQRLGHAVMCPGCESLIIQLLPDVWV